ncbi:MAG: hypothetical protein H6642_09060 [Caldilineaceae bacterium]|nr:hypothetical protein [Caldilineaceae bacterium]
MARLLRLGVQALVPTMLLLAGCSRPPAAPPPSTPAPTPLPAGSCTLAAADGASDEEAIRLVLAAEGEQVVAQTIESLMALWAEESVVVDAQNTPDDATDDQQWLNKDAIRHRYVRTVFPGAPTSIQPADLEISLNGEQATVRATTQIGGEIAPAGDRWTLVKQNGCWLLESLTYNLESNP